MVLVFVGRAVNGDQGVGTCCGRALARKWRRSTGEQQLSSECRLPLSPDTADEFVECHKFHDDPNHLDHPAAQDGSGGVSMVFYESRGFFEHSRDHSRAQSMKFAFAASRGKTAAFTLLEVMVVVGITTMILLVVLGSHLFGLKMASRVQIKLTASDDARQAMSVLIQDIRSAHHLRIGSGSQNSFTAVADGLNQQGDAIEVYLTSSSNSWIRYYYNASDNSLRRTVNGATHSFPTANSLTNTLPLFALEDFLGRVYTNKVPVAGVRVNLSFVQLKNPQVYIAPGNYFDFYQIESRITPRTAL